MKYAEEEYAEQEYVHLDSDLINEEEKFFNYFRMVFIKLHSLLKSIREVQGRI